MNLRQRIIATESVSLVGLLTIIWIRSQIISQAFAPSERYFPRLKGTNRTDSEGEFESSINSLKGNKFNLTICRVPTIFPLKTSAAQLEY